ncbi:hypothetical protein JOC85_000486 [Bacillus mesophilus]|uniref:Uncharacterized protein n=1 Tax=Bacillus mesophilus TaxID=1808955 RepID=A0A6M0Q2Z8_9BACI|nr:hypothetical protein [Bacillus mesophilus]MBM7659719.1 hypothetical protein [Bacillus mesophilus]NEY70582.1 hypothetical protein [Bacillus mesophilus]
MSHHHVTCRSCQSKLQQHSPVHSTNRLQSLNGQSCRCQHNNRLLSGNHRSIGHKCNLQRTGLRNHLGVPRLTPLRRRNQHLVEDHVHHHSLGRRSSNTTINFFL